MRTRTPTHPPLTRSRLALLSAAAGILLFAGAAQAAPPFPASGTRLHAADICNQRGVNRFMQAAVEVANATGATLQASLRRQRQVMNRLELAGDCAFTATTPFVVTVLHPLTYYVPMAAMGKAIAAAQVNVTAVADPSYRGWLGRTGAMFVFVRLAPGEAATLVAHQEVEFTSDWPGAIVD
jgi:hypothetical protein